MQRYIARRLVVGSLTLVLALIFLFFLLRVMPGDVAAAILGEDPDASIDGRNLPALRAVLGTDRPLYVQFAKWLRAKATLDLGESLWSGRTTASIIQARYPVTLQLALMGLLFSAAVGIPVGVVSALKQDTWLDYVPRAATGLLLAVPGFWLGVVIILALVKTVSWMPPLLPVSFFDHPAENLSQFIFPSLVVAAHSAAFIARITRSAMLEVTRQDFIRTARAKGLTESVVVRRHTFRNAMLPVVTVLGIQAANLLTGTTVVEVVFNIPGLGRALIESINRRDYPVIEGLILLFMVTFMIVNLMVDLLYGWLDPRIRYD
ncbi:MAG: ABC transporter permease [Chloroflexi bacterium]|nr:ABC transporter permease [Chloroflexota bacterium]